MLRLFSQHKVRTTQDLAGLWAFTRPADEKKYSLVVPGCWEQYPDLNHYRGQGTYSKILEIETPGTYRLEFKGVSHTADVYLDGEFLGHHYNAYTPFSVIIKNLASGSHELKVDVDNSFSPASALHVPNDYYTYGGLTRGVQLEKIAPTYLKMMHFTPKLVAGIWQAEIAVTLENTGAAAETRQLEVSLAGKNLTRTVTITAETTTTEIFHTEFSDITPWSPKNPQLYFLTGKLRQAETIVDDLVDRVGFRTVAVQANKIILNEAPIFFKGFNRHEDYADIGCAIPLQLMVKDFEIMKDLGANAVRTCHYPNDELFLDLCDERGFLVWEENHARGFDLAMMENPNFDAQCHACNQEMVDNHFNHPAIIIWGILNECASETAEGRRKYAEQYAQIRALDFSRPMTSATCRHFKDICLDFPDIVSFNMYTGWYQDMSVTERHEQELAWIDSTKGQGKPLIVSEFGAGAIYGYRTPTRVKWSEERQADILASNFDVYLTDERLSGVFIWQFADCKVTKEKWFATRPRSENNKGILDEYRRPKLAYDVVKNYFHQAKS